MCAMHGRAQSVVTVTSGAGGRDAPIRAIAGYPARLERVCLGEGALALWVVPNLEHLVDRGALLRGEVEPPYWAHLWSGARALADYVARWGDVRGRRVLELGCGLGLPALVAARAGGAVVAVDRALPALRFLAASAAANGLCCNALCADFRTLQATARFDLVLAAEVAYEPALFPALADVLVRHLAPGGRAFLADAFRTDTRRLYRVLAARGLATRGLEWRFTEEGRPIPIRVTVVAGRRDGTFTTSQAGRGR